MFPAGWVNVVSMLPPALSDLLGAFRCLLWRQAALHAEVIAVVSENLISLVEVDVFGGLDHPTGRCSLRLFGPLSYAARPRPIFRVLDLA